MQPKVIVGVVAVVHETIQLSLIVEGVIQLMVEQKAPEAVVPCQKLHYAQTQGG
jgi:hypothetical protein